MRPSAWRWQTFRAPSKEDEPTAGQRRRNTIFPFIAGPCKGIDRFFATSLLSTWLLRNQALHTRHVGIEARLPLRQHVPAQERPVGSGIDVVPGGQKRQPGGLCAETR